MANCRNGLSLPSLTPDPARVGRLKPLLDRLRYKTGKNLLCINWLSRFGHKNAPAELFFDVAERLSGQYQAVLFKDPSEARIIDQQITKYRAPVQNLSHLIKDFHDTVAAISLVDALMSVDTGIVHAAGALGIPGVALFGPFHAKAHISDYPTIAGVQSGYRGSKCNGPCGETHRGCDEVGFNSNRISPCFRAIKPNEVVEALTSANNC